MLRETTEESGAIGDDRNNYCDYRQRSAFDLHIPDCLAEIERAGEKHIARGEISTDDYQKFNDICDVYKRLGGNGYAKRIKEAVDEVPLKK